jgi:hypothetical protein
VVGGRAVSAALAARDLARRPAGQGGRGFARARSAGRVYESCSER